MSDERSRATSSLITQEEAKKRHAGFVRRGRYVNETKRPYLYLFRGKWRTILTLGPRNELDDLALEWAKEMNDAR